MNEKLSTVSVHCCCCFDFANRVKPQAFSRRRRDKGKRENKLSRIRMLLPTGFITCREECQLSSTFELQEKVGE